MKYLLKAPTYFGVFLFCFGILNFLFHGYIMISGTQLNREMSIASFGQVAEKNDKIYVSIPFYSRVQVYDKWGQYLSYQKTNTHGKDFSMIVFSDTVLTIPTNSIEIKHVFQQNNYQLTRRFPAVLKSSETVNYSRSIIAEGWTTSFVFAGPAQALIIGLIGELIMIFLNLGSILRAFNNNENKREATLQAIRSILQTES